MMLNGQILTLLLSATVAHCNLERQQRPAATDAEIKGILYLLTAYLNFLKFLFPYPVRHSRGLC